MRSLPSPWLAALFASVSVAAAACGGGGVSLQPGTGNATGTGGDTSTSGSGGQGGTSTGSSTTGGSATGGSTTGDGGSTDDGGGTGGGAVDDAGTDGSTSSSSSASSSSSTSSSTSASSSGAGSSSSTSSTSSASSSSTSSSSTSSSSSSSTSSSSSSGALVPCTSDVQCFGTSCQITANAAMNALTLACEPLVGSNGMGVPCTTGSACRDGLCIGGYCSGPCASNGDCSQAGTCQSQTVTVGGLSGTFDVCVVSPCTGPASCPAGEVCSAIQVVNGQPEAFCQGSIAGGGPIGTSCSTGAACASDLCPSWLLSCTQVCTTTADCSAKAGEVCVDLFGGTPPLEGCAPGCSRNADCTASGTTCVFATDTGGNQDRFICSPPSGTGATGTSCAGTNTCGSGLCLSNYTNGTLVDQICTQPCVTSADCPAAFPACIQVSIATPNGSGMQLLNVCDHT